MTTIFPPEILDIIVWETHPAIINRRTCVCDCQVFIRMSLKKIEYPGLQCGCHGLTSPRLQCKDLLAFSATCHHLRARWTSWVPKFQHFHRKLDEFRYSKNIETIRSMSGDQEYNPVCTPDFGPHPVADPLFMTMLKMYNYTIHDSITYHPNKLTFIAWNSAIAIYKSTLAQLAEKREKFADLVKNPLDTALIGRIEEILRRCTPDVIIYPRDAGEFGSFIERLHEIPEPRPFGKNRGNI